MTSTIPSEGPEPGTPNVNTPFLVLGGILLFAGLVFVGYGGFLIVSGEPEAYPKENLRHLAGGLTQASLAAALIALSLRRMKAGWVALVVGTLSVTWSIWLAFGGG